MKKRNQKDLGPLIAKYPIQPLRWLDLLVVFLPLIMLTLTPLGYGLWRTYYGYTNFGPAAARSWGQAWFLASGFLVLILLGYSLRRLIRAHYWVEVHKKGLFLHRSSGQKRLFQWKDLWGITSFSTNRSIFGILQHTKSTLIIHPLQGKPVQFHKDLRDLKGLTKTIKKEVYQRIQPKFGQALKMGKKIPFGDISISKTSLYYRDRVIPWKYIQDIAVEEGKLLFQLSEEQKLTMPIKRLQNIELLIHFIETEISS